MRLYSGNCSEKKGKRRQPSWAGRDLFCTVCVSLLLLYYNYGCSKMKALIHYITGTGCQVVGSTAASAGAAPHDDDSATPQINRKFHPRLLHWVRAITKDLDKKKNSQSDSLSSSSRQSGWEVDAVLSKEAAKFPRAHLQGWWVTEPLQSVPIPAGHPQQDGSPDQQATQGAVEPRVHQKGQPGWAQRLSCRGGGKQGGVKQSDLRAMQMWRKAAFLQKK